MADAGGPSSVRICRAETLADLGDTKAFDREENQHSSGPMGCTKEHGLPGRKLGH